MRPGEVALLGLTGIRATTVPEDAVDAARLRPAPDAVAGVVWRDLRPGGGRPGVLQRGEAGLPGVTVELRRPDGGRATSAITQDDGSLVFAAVPPGDYRVATGATTFGAAFGGVSWLGSDLITPAIVLSVIGVAWLIPTLGLLVTSLMLPEEVQLPGWWNVLTEPGLLGIDNYREVLDDESSVSLAWTTVWIPTGETVPPIPVGDLAAAYAFAFLDFPGRDGLLIIVVGLLVVPVQMALIPIFWLYDDLGIVGTVLSLVLFHSASGLPFAIFLLRNLFAGIPRELLEAARMDCASGLRIFLRVILPLGLPAIAFPAIFQFPWTWNDLLIALTPGRETQPITVTIFSQLRQFGVSIGFIAPAAFISLAIPLAVFVAFQRYFVQGLRGRLREVGGDRPRPGASHGAPAGRA